MDSARLSTKSLHDLLSQQLQAAYECLALNQAISARLGDNGQMLANTGLLSARSHDSSRRPHFMEGSIATHAAFGKWMLRHQMKLPINEQGGVPEDSPARGDTSSAPLKPADSVPRLLLSSNDHHQRDGLQDQVSKKSSMSNVAAHGKKGEEGDAEQLKKGVRKQDTVNNRDDKITRIHYKDEEEVAEEDEEDSSFDQNDTVRRGESETDLEQQMMKAEMNRTTGSDLTKPLLQHTLEPSELSFAVVPNSSIHSPHVPKRRKGHGQGLAKCTVKAKNKVPTPKKKEYNVEDLYKTTGCAQKVARSNRFQSLTLLVILLNTIWIAVDTDYNKSEVLCEAAPIFQFMDNAFCFYFTFEVLIRFFSFKTKSDACLDPWFMSDSALVILMIWETWIQVPSTC